MKKAIKALRKTIPEIISVLVLLFIHLYFFAIVGMLVYPRYYRVDKPHSQNETNTTFGLDWVANSHMVSSRNESNHYFVKNKFFPNLKDTIVNLIILLTTANNPDAMEQSYSRNRFSSVYFVIFLVIGTYCIMSLITAVIYNKFKGKAFESLLL
jgi:two pore calcium channel protein 2